MTHSSFRSTRDWERKCEHACKKFQSSTTRTSTTPKYTSSKSWETESRKLCSIDQAKTSNRWITWLSIMTYSTLRLVRSSSSGKHLRTRRLRPGTRRQGISQHARKKTKSLSTFRQVATSTFMRPKGTRMIVWEPSLTLREVGSLSSHTSLSSRWSSTKKNTTCTWGRKRFAIRDSAYKRTEGRTM